MIGCNDPLSGRPNFSKGEKDTAAPDGGPAYGGDITPYDAEIDAGSPGGAPGSCSFVLAEFLMLESVRLQSVTVRGLVFDGEDPIHSDAGAMTLTRSAPTSCPGSAGHGDGGGAACSPCAVGAVKWWRSVSSGSFTQCNDDTCGDDDPNSCSGKYTGTLTYGDPTLECNDLGPLNAHINGQMTDNTDDISTGAQSGCVAGNGHFDLLPLHVSDFDRDGLRGGSLLAIQTTGSGVLTRNAWISSITVTNAPSAGTLRVLRSAEPYSYSGHDELLNATQLATVLAGTTPFDSGVLRGNAPFVSSELSPGQLNSYEVDMAWTCGSGAPTVTRPQGYTFRLSDVGCPAIQKMTLRVGTSPNRVILEQYGYLGTAIMKPTFPGPDGQHFTYAREGLVIEGAVVSSTAQQAQVKLSTITFDGDPVCTPGTYTFGVEQ